LRRSACSKYASAASVEQAEVEDGLREPGEQSRRLSERAHGVGVKVQAAIGLAEVGVVAGLVGVTIGRPEQLDDGRVEPSRVDVEPGEQKERVAVFRIAREHLLVDQRGLGQSTGAMVRDPLLEQGRRHGNIAAHGWP